MKLIKLIHSERAKLFFGFMLVLSISMVNSKVLAQNQPVVLHGKDVTLKTVFKEIERQTNTFIDYKIQDINDERIIPEAPQGKNLKAVMEALLEGTKCTFTFQNNHIIITKQNQPAAESNIITVTGVVVDEAKEPMVGVSVVIKGTTSGVITDINGKFSLETIANSTLQISFLGYITQEIAVKESINLTIVLKENSQTLDEVVVVGYGTQKKINLTGSVAAISSKQLQDRAQTDVLKAAQGKVPGVTIISRPGQTPSINFRGRGNLGSSEPLYVIDGVISSPFVFSNLDPNSIDAISFLKDAASSSIYGSRAAYGVVLVTTKGGGAGKLNISYNGLIGISNPTYKTKYVNSWEYAELYNEALYNSKPESGKNQGYSAEEIGWFKDGSKPDLYPNTRWDDLILDKNVLTTQHSVNFSGGNDNITYFTGLGYMYNDNIIPDRYDNRYNLTINLVASITKWLNVRSSVKYIQNKNKVESGTPFLGNFAVVPPTFVAKHTDGSWGSINGGKLASLEFIQRNPLRVLNNKDWSDSKTENAYYDMGIDLKPLKGMVVSGSGVYKTYEYKRKGYTALADNIKNNQTGDIIAGSGNSINKMDMNWQSTSTILYTSTLKYNWQNSIHNINTLLGASYEHYKYENLGATRDNFPVDGLTDINGGSMSGAGYTNSGGSSENKMLSYFGRINYILKDRYLFEVNLRADASSRFHKDHRWGYFPSFSAGWRLNEESFMNRLMWLDNLKIRASWGTLGNINNVGDYDYFQNYSASSDYSFDDQPVKGVKESKPANASLSWEKVAISDIGVDFEILNGLFGISADYYVKNTSNILLGYSVPLETGIESSPSQNIGKVRNTGFEIALTHRKKINDFSYELSVNLATNKNKVIDLATSNNIISGKFILKEGESIGSFYGYKTDGLYTQGDIDAGRYYKLDGVTPNAGDIKFLPSRPNIEYKDAITAEDRTIIGCDVPNFTYGINVTLQYKKFDFSVFGQGVNGTMVAFDTYGLHPFFHGMDSPREFHLKRWTQENPDPNAIYPRLYSASNAHTKYNWNFNDQHLFNADYFRIKTITIGYFAPKTFINNWGISALKVFVTCENMFTVRADKKMKDFDPETSGNVISTFGTKSFAFGLNLSF